MCHTCFVKKKNVPTRIFRKREKKLGVATGRSMIFITIALLHTGT